MNILSLTLVRYKSNTNQSSFWNVKKLTFIASCKNKRPYETEKNVFRICDIEKTDSESSDFLSRTRLWTFPLIYHYHGKGNSEFMF